MNLTTQARTPRDWAVEHFGGADLSDVRRVDRAVFIAEAMATSPGVSFSQMFLLPCDVEATYAFLRNPDVTPDHIQAGHRERTLCAMEKPGRYLLLEDTSEIRCAETGEIIGLGPIGGSKNARIGFHLHSVLTVGWPDQPDVMAPRRPHVQIIGLADQQFHVRKPRAGKDRTSLRRKLPPEELESSLWEKASRRIGPAPEREDVVWIKVGDRGADIYDHLGECGKQNHRYIIRATKDRALLDEKGKKAGNLLTTAVATPPLAGEVSLDLRTRGGQAARTARLRLSLTPVIIRSPQTRGMGKGKRPPVRCTVVRVFEPDPPPGVKALEWFLLTDLPVETFAEAAEVAQMYATRWLEEEFHKALKTGMAVEGAQLETAPAWFAAVALKSVAALRLIEMRERLHSEPEAPAEQSGLSELELAVLRLRLRAPVRTVREVALGIGRLGGHLNRRGDGLPGWITLWRGWTLLETLVEGALLGRKPEQRE